MSGSDAVLSLAGNALEIGMSNAQLLFPLGRTSGAIQTQFFPFEHLGVSMMPNLRPLWAYATQPRGVEVEGPVSIRIAMPKLRGSYDYIPPGTERVVLLGYSPGRKVLAPIGVGRIENYSVFSEGSVALENLDYIAYVMVPQQHQPLLAAVAAGSKSLNQLIAELQ
ncbi:hypothetical protein [Allohahella sp. A8]|uniref:hypothetical protein n=1 Tax=Allohahella sp. A8 TaxID=3141461 RepID=UPI003A8052C4